jgi:hypothetical protein
MLRPVSLTVLQRHRWLCEQDWIFTILQVLLFAIAVFFGIKLPPPGYAVTVLAFAAALMGFELNMSGARKGVWGLIILLFLGAELRAIRQDRISAEKQFKTLLDSEREGFSKTVEGLKTVLKQNQGQFDKSMRKTQDLLNETKTAADTAKEAVLDVTGGKTWAYADLLFMFSKPGRDELGNIGTNSRLHSRHKANIQCEMWLCMLTGRNGTLTRCLWGTRKVNLTWERSKDTNLRHLTRCCLLDRI